jgi:signal transduction histidine kinase
VDPRRPVHNHAMADNDAGTGRTLEDSGARVSSREALRFLTRVGRVLSTSLDLDRTLRGVVRLAVPRVACFTAIDLAGEDGRLERRAYSHIDAELAPLLHRPGPFTPETEGLLPLAEVLGSGEPLMLANLEDEWPRDRPADQQGLERLRRLQARSLIVVPLEARDAVLGTLTLGSTRTDRFYRREDLALARELARSASLALENARLYRQAQRAIQGRDEVLSVVSHDLRNPVGRVRMAAELLLEAQPASAETRPGGAGGDGGSAGGSAGTLHLILRAADEMTRLIEDLLDVARIEEGRLSLERGPVELSHLLDRLDEAHAAAADRAGIEWSVERPSSPVVVDIDAGRVLQALGNLIGNALKFTPEGGTVRVVTEAEDDAVRTGVVDTGPGMEPEALAHVFDRFWQARKGDRRGAGLGLAIARGIIEGHGGRLWMESEPGSGTTAWVELPRP